MAFRVGISTLLCNKMTFLKFRGHPDRKKEREKLLEQTAKAIPLFSLQTHLKFGLGHQNSLLTVRLLLLLMFNIIKMYNKQAN